ncbi:hypothetical protein [Parasphingorhabdus sp.]|uniref:WYL domain-containing protein n=1 Tax=Parasphingorhabdus sp. TaxID=2709688 RepID=UPI003A8D244F
MGDFWTSISNKFVRPKLADRFVLSTEDTLTDELEQPQDKLNWAADFGPISGVPCILIYKDSKGQRSERLVTCQRYDLHNEVPYLWAFCHMRSAVRQFKIERVLEVYDPESGEAFESSTAFFSQFSVDQTHQSKPGWGLSVSQKADFSALLNANVFIARCDNDYHHLEREALENVITKYWLRFEINNDPDCESIVHYADKLAPDAETFWVSLHRIAADPKLVRLLKETVSNMIEADGVLAREEFYWGSQIDEFFSANG